MTPKLKPLLLPQMVERRKHEVQQTTIEGDMTYVYYTANSSSSDVASPITPTFSTKGHVRVSSSTSSLDLPPQLQDSPVSPSQPGHPLASKRALPDVQEEPMEREEDEESINPDDYDIYTCLCMFESNDPVGSNVAD